MPTAPTRPDAAWLATPGHLRQFERALTIAERADEIATAAGPHRFVGATAPELPPAPIGFAGTAVSTAPRAHRMLCRLALALLQEHPAVARSSRGRLNWTQAARRRTDGAPSEPLVRLSHDERAAAEEIAANLGDPTFVREIQALDASAAHARVERLRALGEAIWGEEWISPLARHANVALRTAQRWAVGETRYPDGLIEELRPAIDAARERLRRRLDALETIDRS